MRPITILLFILSSIIYLKGQEASSIVFEDTNGCLRYVSDTENNCIPDFSHAGYKNRESPLPEISVAKTIGPIAGDNTAHIQTALDEIGALPLDDNGYRGALLLEPGNYEIRGIVTIRESGVVLRGSGSGADAASNTILLGIGNTPTERDILRLGDAVGVNWTRAVPGTNSLITSEFVPVGSRSLEVAAPELYSIGNNVIIYQPSTRDWLASINFGDTDIDAPWSPGEIDLYYNRYVTSVNFQENKITLDAPIFDHLERALAQSEIYVLNEPNIKHNIGVENLRIDIQTAGPMDEDHAKNAIRLIGVEDCWVKNVTALHFTYAAVDMTIASRVTVKDCQGLEPHSLITGARRYNFAVGRKTNNVLFENCHATEGRHSFVSNGASSASGIVFYNCTSERDYGASEGHRRWSQALLYDNISFSNAETNTLLALYNRGSYGTGHGWSAVHSVAWQVKMNPFERIILQKPPLRQNYAIACQAFVTNSHQFLNPRGFIELTNKTPLIRSLYAAQFDKRMALGVAPDAPARLTAEVIDEDILLKWIDIASNETAYKLEWSIDGGDSFSEIAELPANATSFVHMDAQAATGELIYRIYAAGSHCPSPYSNPVRISLATSVQVPAIPQLKVFPNPVNDQLFIQSNSSFHRVAIYDTMGKLLDTRKIVNGLHTNDWVKGVYYLRIFDDKGNVSEVKMLKK